MSTLLKTGITAIWVCQINLLSFWPFYSVVSFICKTLSGETKKQDCTKKTDLISLTLTAEASYQQLVQFRIFTPLDNPHTIQKKTVSPVSPVKPRRVILSGNTLIIVFLIIIRATRKKKLFFLWFCLLYVVHFKKDSCRFIFILFLRLKKYKHLKQQQKQWTKQYVQAKH